MSILLVPPSTLAVSSEELPVFGSMEHARRVYIYFSAEPVVVHDDTVLENELVVLAAMYLEIPNLPVIVVDSLDDYIPDEALDYAGPSNDA